MNTWNLRSGVLVLHLLRKQAWMSDERRSESSYDFWGSLQSHCVESWILKEALSKLFHPQFRARLPLQSKFICTVCVLCWLTLSIIASQWFCVLDCYMFVSVGGTKLCKLPKRIRNHEMLDTNFLFEKDLNWGTGVLHQSTSSSVLTSLCSL